VNDHIGMLTDEPARTWQEVIRRCEAVEVLARLGPTAHAGGAAGSSRRKAARARTEGVRFTIGEDLPNGDQAAAKILSRALPPTSPRRSGRRQDGGSGAVRARELIAGRGQHAITRVGPTSVAQERGNAPCYRRALGLTIS
jgi:hypothetical protein